MAKQYQGNGQWVDVTVNDRPSRTSSTPPKATTTTPPSNEVKKTETGVDAKAKKEYTKAENVLKGTLTVVPDPTLKAKQTVMLEGFGGLLSGLYFVDRVTHTFSNNGYAQSLEVSRNGFGNSLKKAMVTQPIPTPPPDTRDDARAESKPAVQPKVETKTHTLRSGDTLWSLAVKHYGDGTKWTKIAEANGIKQGEERRLSVGREIKLP